MRVLSFIPAFLLAAASFVAAAPTPTPDTSCTTTGGDSSALQPLINILVNVTAEVEVFTSELANLPTGCTVDDVTPIVSGVTAVIAVAVGQIQALASIDLTGLDLTTLCLNINICLAGLIAFLNALLAICLHLGVTLYLQLGACITLFVKACLDLTACLAVYAVADIAVQVKALCAALNVGVQLCVSIFGLSL